MMMTSFCSRPAFNQILCQSLMVGVLAAVGLLSGLTPELSKDSQTLVFSTSAYAQAVTDEELSRYVRASLKIEQLRLVVYNEIKKVNGGNVPEIDSCSSQGVPGNIRAIWQNFCQQSQSITDAEGFSNTRYNAITRMRQADGNLERRVKEEAARQQ
jgi:hypothetical protein